MSDIDLAKVGFVGNFADVQYAYDVLLVDCKDFKIKIENVEREITHFAISIPWLENSGNDAVKIYDTIISLINVQGTASSFESDPKPSTISPGSGDIWFVLNVTTSKEGKKKFSSPNSALLPVAAMKGVKRAIKSKKPCNATRAKNLILKHSQAAQCRQETINKQKQKQYEKEKAIQDSIEGITKETLITNFKKEGCSALGKESKRIVRSFLACFLSSRLGGANCAPDHTKHILKALKNANLVNEWNDWLSNENTIGIMTQILNKNKQHDSLAGKVATCYMDSNYRDIITKGIDREVIIGIAEHLFEKFKETHSDKFTQNSTGGQNLGQTNVQIIGSSQTNPTNIRKGPQIKVDDQNIHHRIRRYKNKKTVGKADVRHRFGKWKNKN